MVTNELNRGGVKRMSILVHRFSIHVILAFLEDASHVKSSRISKMADADIKTGCTYRQKYGITDSISSLSLHCTSRWQHALV